MAATELTEQRGIAVDASRRPARQTGGQPLAAAIAAAWLYAYTSIWAATLAVAGLLALAGRALLHPTRQVLGLTLRGDRNPPPHLAHVLILAAHNIPVAAWPLLLGLTGAARHRLARSVADSVVLACVIVNTLPVGAALAAYGTPLLPYVPQLPLEWAGLALGYGSWLVQRKRTLSTGERIVWLALIASVLLCAAALETLAVPHR
jgi:hypothetical protein